jgi:hypothetical protein
MAKASKPADENVKELEFNADLSGVLVADGKRKDTEIQKMTTEDTRNTVIVELWNYFPGVNFPSFHNEKLINTYGMVIVLKKAFGKSSGWFMNVSIDNTRNTLIVELDKKTKKGIKSLQALSNGELVQLAKEVFNKSKKVLEVVEFRFEQNPSETMREPPSGIYESYYANHTSISYKKVLNIEENTSKSSKFWSTTGSSFNYGNKLTVEAEVPMVGKATGEVSMNFGVSHDFGSAKESVTTKIHTDRTEITIEPGKIIKCKMYVSKAKMKVKWYATIRTTDGILRNDEGFWEGIESINQYTDVSYVTKDDVLKNKNVKDVKELSDAQ